MTNFALPLALRSGIESYVLDNSGRELPQRTERISENYNLGKPSRGVIADAGDVAAYLAARMPATYAACAAALSALSARAPSFAPLTMLDVGAGPGTASWAAVEHWPMIQSLSLVDENEEMLRAARMLSAGAGSVSLREARIEQAAISPAVLGGSYDLVVAGYLLAELAPSEIKVMLENLWRAALGALVIVEPGTPEGFERIRRVRELLSDAGAEIAAPCPHGGPCPIRSPDWCHFAQRLARSRDHMHAKGGKLPFEDEKFIYLAVSRGLTLEKPEARILDRPRAEKFGLEFKLCGETNLSKRLVLKRDKPSYRAVAHKKWGDTLPT